MSVQKQTFDHSGLLRHHTFNIITNKEDGFLSVLCTSRRASDAEKERADWLLIIPKGDDIFHIVGKGDELSPGYLNLLVSSYVDGGGPWVSVDLSALDMGPTGFESFRKGKTSAELNAARRQYQEDTAAVDFDNPVWRAVKDIAREVVDHEHS